MATPMLRRLAPVLLCASVLEASARPYNPYPPATELVWTYLSKGAAPAHGNEPEDATMPVGWASESSLCRAAR